MPAKNSQKLYLANSYYHIYNRGVEKRKIFLDKQDHTVFLSYIKDYLTSKNEKKLYQKLGDASISSKEKDKILKLLRMNNFSDEITLLAYCLMPNHFHFFIKQKSPNSIDSFMQSFSTRYSMYFNKKYKRVGGLFQGVYKAVVVETETQFLYLSKYIHKQALASQGETLRSCVSSYEDYIGKRKTEWLKPEEILEYFKNENPSLSYEDFINENEENKNDLLKQVAIEE